MTMSRVGMRKDRRRRWGRVWLTGLMALVMAAMCLIADPAAARRPAAAAPPTDLALATGYNESGQLGDGTTTERTVPVEVALPEGVTLTEVSGGGNHSLAVTSDGRVLAWGQNLSGQLGDGTNIQRTTPVYVNLPAGVTITHVSAGWSDSLAVTSDGRVLAWGGNLHGQLGDGTTTPRNTPVFVDLPAGVSVTQVAAAEYHSLAVASDGRGLAWGWNQYGELGDGTTTERHTPVFVLLPAGAAITQVDTYEQTSMAVTSDGRGLAWGRNQYGQVGDGTLTDRHTPVYVALPSGTTITQIAAGYYHSLAVTSDGRELAWGRNLDGQLGDGTTVNRSTPVEVALPEGVTVTDTDAGQFHSLALASDGRVLAWGSNSFGQLGDGSTTRRTTPVFMILPEGEVVTALSGGAYHSLLLAEPARSATSLTAVPTEAAPGQEVGLTANVTCNAGAPTGTVTFLDGDTVIGTAELGADGTATLTTSSLEPGRRQIIARYEGNGRCPPSTSEPVTVTITEEPTPPGPCGWDKLKVEKTVDRTKVKVGEHVTYRVRVTNTCDTVFRDAAFTDDLSGVLDDAQLVGSPHASTGHVTYTPPRLHWVGDLEPGATAEITYTFVARKPGKLHNHVTWHCRAPETNKVRWDCTITTTTKVTGTKHH
ncbi:DUF11 domain-containing protein [Actinomadura syzygii]|uniref:DUF11 domain-containing protein n=2 Tax=Actinomadura syzygii TaxID=1427538 RepID=A0A5D0U8V0_9ACTN|nr:DUF11 domain-containing protein [Actinomadura syzygii]